MDVTGKISSIKILPVIKMDTAQKASLLAEALCAGGLPAAEVTFRSDAAEATISIIAREYPEMLVGAGTLVSIEQAQRAMDAGAAFFVTAGFNRAVTEYAVKKDIPIFPGVCTPTELMFLLEYGLTVAKFFPAGQFGGLSTIKAFAGPFPNMRFMPTGGVDAGNVLDYLSFDKVIACGGSWMVKDSLIKDGNFEEIRRLTREAMDIVRGA